MRSVEVRSTCVLSRMDFQAGSSMKDAVASALEAVGPGLQPKTVSYQSSGEVVRGWDATGRQLGQDLVVEVIGEPLSSRVEQQQQQLNKQALEIAELHELHARSQLRKVRNLSSQILLVAIGESSRESKSSRFRKLGTSDLSVQTAAASLGVSAQEFVNAADGIVTRRNKAIHPSDVEELEELVEEMAGLITPALQRKAKWECMMILKYADIKAAFKANFGA